MPSPDHLVRVVPRFGAIPGLLALAAACGASAPPATAPAPPATVSRPLPDSVRHADAPRPRTPAPTPPAAPSNAPRTTHAVRTARIGATSPGGEPHAASRSARNDTLPAAALHAPVRVCAGGDVTLGTNLFPEWAAPASRRMRTRFNMADDPASLLAPLKPLLQGSEVVLLNVESAIGEGRTESKCGPQSTNCFAFRSPPSAAPALRALSRASVIGNIANNHTHDAGDAGADTTAAMLRRAGVLVTGADTLATAVPTLAGDTIGVLGFYTSADTPDARDTAAVYRHVARAARQYPVVIATMHLGAEGRDAQRTLDGRELFLHIDRGNPVAFADAAVRGGAAMVIGHGPHVMRAMEWRPGGALIAYSLGNLLTYGPFVLKEPLNRGAVLCATLDRTGRVAAAELRPTMQRAPGVLARDPSSTATVLVDSLSRLDFPSTGVRAAPRGTLSPHRSP